LPLIKETFVIANNKVFDEIIDNHLSMWLPPSISNTAKEIASLKVQVEEIQDKLLQKEEKLIEEAKKLEQVIYNLEFTQRERNDAKKELESVQGELERAKDKADKESEGLKKSTEKRWANLFPKLHIPGNVIRMAVKNFKHDDLGNVERTLMEIYKDKINEPKVKRKEEAGKWKVEFESNAKNTAGRIYYKLSNTNADNKEGIEIIEIYLK